MSQTTIEIVPSTTVIELDDGTSLRLVEVEGQTIEIVQAGSIVINTTGSSALVHQQSAPSASWIISHTLGRLPQVSVYLASGEEVDTDVFSTTTQVNITFPAATAGWAVIS